MSRLIAGLESVECQVTRDAKGNLEVLLPGWDETVLPFESVLPLQQLFWDRMVVRVDERGVARYRMVYWTGVQPLLHLVIAAVFAVEAWSGAAARLVTPLQFVLAFLAAQLVPAALILANAGFSRRSALRRAFA